MDGRGRRGTTLFASALVVAMLGGCSPAPSPATPTAAATRTATPPPATAAPTSGPTATPVPDSPSTATATLPDFPFVWIVVLENKDYERIANADDLPYIESLIERFGLATQSYGVARPSQPNYFALFSGSTHGVGDNDDHDIDAPTLADQIEASGRTWREYAENRPADCFTGSTASGGRDGKGTYERKHAPAISFDSIRTNPARCVNLVDLSAFRPGDADFSLIVPNQCHSGHDCRMRDVDTWLSGFLPGIIESDAFARGGLLVLTTDEDDAGDDPHGGHIATIVASPDVPAGFRSDERHDHYSVLRTIQDAWGLGCLAQSCNADTMDEFFTSP
jgi:acid phosphatase